MDPGVGKKLGEILLDNNFITQDHLVRGMQKQRITKNRLGEILTELGFVTEERLNQALAIQVGKLPPNSPPTSTAGLSKGKKLGEILLDSKLITKDHFLKAMEEQKKTNKRLGEVLTALGFVTEEKLARCLSEQLGIP